MYKILNVKTKSITEAKQSFSNLIKEANSTGEPIYILNHNKPAAVILDSNVNETIVKERQALEEELLYYKINSRVTEGPGTLIPASEVIKADQADDPFTNISNEELFD